MALSWKKMKGEKAWLLILLPFAAGAVITLCSARAMTATDQAAFCGGCHSMAEAALSHSKSVHSKQACNECHAPHDIIRKIPFKTKEGARDMFVTATKQVPDYIHPGKNTMEVVQENCLRCHSTVVKEVNMQSKAHCTDCHRHVPHSPKIPIAKRSAADV